MKLFILLLLSVALTGCATPDAVQSNAPVPKEAKTNSPSQPNPQLEQAVLSPLNDLNLTSAEIPPILKSAQKGPYKQGTDRTCAGLSMEVGMLDAVLGPDLDVPASATNPGLVERGAETIGNAAVGALRGAAEGVIPFRSWVRKLTGAERHSREVAAAIAAGTIRRAYLKGVGQAAGCKPPAAPQG